jgi:hypothetical protein
VSVVLAVVSVIALLASLLGVWGARTALNSDVFVSRVGPLTAEPAVAESLADYLTTEVVQTLNVEGFLSENLPPQARLLARPLTEALTSFVRREVTEIIESDAFNAVWTRVISGAHELLVDAVDSNNTIVTTGDDTITVNLLPAIGAVLESLTGSSPELTGPVAGALESLANDPPVQAIAAIEQATGLTLPASFGVVVIDDGGTLGTVRTVVRITRVAVVGLVLLTFAATVGSVLAAPRRRRRAMQLLGAWAVSAAVVRQVALWLADTLASQVRDPVNQQAV